jgi:hypothetical protein
MDGIFEANGVHGLWIITLNVQSEPVMAFAAGFVTVNAFAPSAHVSAGYAVPPALM